jgi:ubiquinone biosynthesis protein UbiJ
LRDTDFTEFLKKGLLLIPEQLVQRFETLLNHYLHLDPEASHRISALTGKVIAVDVLLGPHNKTTPRITLYFAPETQGCQVHTTCPGEPDVVIRGTPMSLINQLYKNNPGVMVNDFVIEGDLSVGKAFQAVARGMHIDWEEQLAYRVGDLPAHQMGNAARKLHAWTQHSLHRLIQNTGEYLHYEASDLPPPRNLNEFMDAVDKMRHDTERLEARIQRLQQEASLSITKQPTHN